MDLLLHICPVGFSCKQTTVLFTWNVSHIQLCAYPWVSRGCILLQQLLPCPWPASPALPRPAPVAAPPPRTSPHHRLEFIISVLSPHCLSVCTKALLRLFVLIMSLYSKVSLSFPCSSLLLRFSMCVPKLWPPLPRRPLVFSSRTPLEGAAAARTPPVTQMTLLWCLLT